MPGLIILNMTDAPPRPAAPLDESAYTLSIDEAADRYAAAGFPRPVRRLQKYCVRGDLESRKVETPSGERYLITPESIERHISFIKETSERARARPAAPSGAKNNLLKIGKEEVAPGLAPPRSAAPERVASDNTVQLEKRIEEKDDEIHFLRSEVAVKNDQIKDLTERARETNHLIAGLQRMLIPPRGGSSDSRE